MSKGSQPVRLPAAPLGSDGAAARRSDLSRHHWANAVFLGTQVALDAALVPLAFSLAARLAVGLDLIGPLTVTLEHAAIMLGITLGMILGVFGAGGMYRLGRGASRVDTFYKVCTHVTLGLILAIAANAVVLQHDAIFSRRLLLLGWLLTIALITSGRLLHGHLVGQIRVRGVAVDRLLIVGTGTTSRMVFDTVRHRPELGYEVAGFLSHRSDSDPPRGLDGLPVFGSTERMADVVRAQQIDELILAVEELPHEETLDLVYQVMDLPVTIKVYPDIFRLITNDELSVGDLGGLPMVTVRTVGLRAWSRVVKRAVDLLLSTLVLIFLSPLMLLLALLIKLDSPGPAFFVQERVGHDGVPFNLLKFRSMPLNAEAVTGPVWATPDDSRPTRMGRFMRRYSLDELPQFINVLLGEMSVVGPRPERPYFVEQFRQTIPRYMARHREKSGITGWAQVNGLRGDTSIEERTHYDLYYVENWSLLFDVKIMVKTLARVLDDENAY